MDVCERVNSSERRLFVEQIATVVALGCGRKVDAMWHVPQRIRDSATVIITPGDGTTAIKVESSA